MKTIFFVKFICLKTKLLIFQLHLTHQTKGKEWESEEEKDKAKVTDVCDIKGFG